MGGGLRYLGVRKVAWGICMVALDVKEKARHYPCFMFFLFQANINFTFYNGGGGGRTDERTDGRTDFPCFLQGVSHQM